MDRPAGLSPEGPKGPLGAPESTTPSTSTAPPTVHAAPDAPDPHVWDDGLIARRATSAKPAPPERPERPERPDRPERSGHPERPAQPALPESLGAARGIGVTDPGRSVDGPSGSVAGRAAPAASPASAPPFRQPPGVPESGPAPESGTAAARTGYAPRPGFTPGPAFGFGALRPRLDALRELVGLSRTRLDRRALGDAGRVLDEAAARGRHSLGHTVVALAGATGSGKSTLFNALAGVELSEAGIRRPTTAEPMACAWTDHADGLLDRLGILPGARHLPAHPYDPALRGLVLLDLPDHDSAAAGHRERVDRLLGLVDAVVWVVDPEKYADAVLHERYLRPLAGYAEVTFVVLNQIDRLPGDAADQVLDDLRRLLDEDGLALGEHGEPGAAVLAVSALTGAGMGELREALGRFVGECGAAERRLAADVDGVTGRLRSSYVADGGWVGGLSERARAEFENRLADAAGAAVVGQAAERAWLRAADRACGTPWSRLWSRRSGGGRDMAGGGRGRLAAVPVAARPAVEEAVRNVADEAATGLPTPWAQAVREAARHGAMGLPEAMDEAVAATAPGGQPPRPRWWSVAAVLQGALLVVQLVGAGWLLAAVAERFSAPVGAGGIGSGWWAPALLLTLSAAGGPMVTWGCALLARGPAQRYGQLAERRLREAAAECGRTRVLEPVAAELMRYRGVREQYAIAAARSR
nr:YfjP family GTPase [Streptomyces sp. SAJ15]